MTKNKTEWKSDPKLPDEDYLKAEWEAELKFEEGSRSGAKEFSERKRSNLSPLLKASGLDANEQAKQAKIQSRNFFKKIETELTTPPLDFETQHKQDLELAQKNQSLKEGPGNPSWSGYVFNATSAGYWLNYSGEAEEVPNATYSMPAARIDPRAQSWGEGDGLFHYDYSRVHAYLGFRFNPPSWGHLHVHAYPWLHGYYSLYSNDEWWNWEEARVEVDTWVRFHQYNWQSRQYQRRLTRAGQEYHPTVYGRMDGRYGQSYYTDIGANDTVTVQVGVQLYCQTRAGGSHAILNFQAGDGNYIHVPYIYWYLHH